MKYLKSVPAGLAMAPVGLSLCSAKMGHYFDGKNKKSEGYKYAQTNHWHHNEGFWSASKGLIANVFLFIPTAMLGSVFHDYIGHNATQQVNDYFGTHISSYIFDSFVFGTSISGLLIGLTLCNPYSFDKNNLYHYSQPFIYAECIIQGFVMGVTAGLGAYAADETLDDFNPLSKDNLGSNLESSTNQE